jgi:diaminopimelate decarboxylase
MTMELRTAGYTVTRLDLGGGLGVPYQAEHDPPTPAAYAAVVENTLGDLDVLFSFEPGRLIAGNAGILLTRVIRHQPRPNRDIIVLDAGMNDLIRPAMYEAFHELIPVKEPKGAARQSFDLVGPVCETGDTFAKNRLLPPMDAGDLAVFMTAGAYGATMSSTYNGRALVPEVLVNGDQFAVVRDRIDIEQKLSHERLPPWMKAG